MSRETTLARDNGRLSSSHIAGSAVPKEESGSPKPIYRIKIIVIKIVVINGILAQHLQKIKQCVDKINQI